jgi:hypothetical protein
MRNEFTLCQGLLCATLFAVGCVPASRSLHDPINPSGCCHAEDVPAEAGSLRCYRFQVVDVHGRPVPQVLFSVLSYTQDRRIDGELVVSSIGPRFYTDAGGLVCICVSTTSAISVTCLLRGAKCSFAVEDMSPNVCKTLTVRRVGTREEKDWGLQEWELVSAGGLGCNSLGDSK